MPVSMLVVGGVALLILLSALIAMIGDRGREEAVTAKRLHDRLQQPKFEVQMVRMVPNGTGGYTVGSSWAPRVVYGEAEAEAASSRLYRDNQWGTADSFPMVKITPLNDNNSEDPR